jgi:uncharacterized protein YciI
MKRKPLPAGSGVWVGDAPDETEHGDNTELIDPVRTALAHYAHMAWIHRTGLLLTMGAKTPSGAVKISAGNVQWLQQQSRLTFAELQPEKQAACLSEADNIMSIIEAAERTITDMLVVTTDCKPDATAQQLRLMFSPEWWAAFVEAVEK